MLNPLAIASPPKRAQSFPPVSLERVMNDVLAVESAFVSKFLPYRTMTQLPTGFQEFAQWHFRRLDDDGIRWQDAAPAYALACLSHAAYGSTFDPSVEWELELQWADLKGLSRLDWPTARRLIVAAWTFLTGSDQVPTDLDAAIDALNASAEPASALPLDPDDDDSPGAWLASELMPAFVVLRESMAEKNPASWRTRGQERWVSPEVNAICLAMSPALAVLEAVTMQGFLDEEKRYLVRVAFPAALMHLMESPVEAWRERPQRDQRRGDQERRGSQQRQGEQQRHGDRWALERRSALLRVPSAVCPGEFNVLANVLHPDFVLLQRIDAFPLNMDRRQRSN